MVVLEIVTVFPPRYSIPLSSLLLKRLPSTVSVPELIISIALAPESVNVEFEMLRLPAPLLTLIYEDDCLGNPNLSVLSNLVSLTIKLPRLTISASPLPVPKCRPDMVMVPVAPDICC